MANQTSPASMPLKTVVSAMVISAVVFLVGNAALFLMLYPPDPVVVEPAVVPTTVAPVESAGETSFTSMSGDWVRENGIITQRALDRVDFMTASGIQGERYIVTVEITLPSAADVPEAGGGLVFHMRQRDSLAESQMVRFHQNGQEILWGWYDAAASFQYQGGQPLPASESLTRTLTLIVRGSMYDIVVDDVSLQSDLPLQTGSGYIGLLSYRGNVSFTNFRLVIGAGS